VLFLANAKVANVLKKNTKNKQKTKNKNKTPAGYLPRVITPVALDLK
jgi:hypothetical protein